MAVQIPELDAKGLRQFALVGSAIVAGAFGLMLPWLLGRPVPIWPWLLAVVLVTWGLAAPATLRPVYRVWMRFGHVAGRVTTFIVLTVVFYAVVTPLGMVRAMLGHDALARRFDRCTASYRVRSTAPKIDNMERPY